MAYGINSQFPTFTITDATMTNMTIYNGYDGPNSTTGRNTLGEISIKIYAYEIDALSLGIRNLLYVKWNYFTQTWTYPTSGYNTSISRTAANDGFTIPFNAYVWPSSGYWYYATAVFASITYN